MIRSSRDTVRSSAGASLNVTTTLLVQQVLNGLLDGVYYLLIALGLSLIFSLGGIVNLAHGGFFAIGAYLTVTLAELSRLRRRLRGGAGGGRAARRADRALPVPTDSIAPIPSCRCC